MIKLYAWQQKGHGEQSFFVAAESQRDAQVSVEKLIADNPYIESHGWGTDYYELSVLDVNEVAFNSND